jgi:hypothetical protein
MLWILEDSIAEPAWYVACKDGLLEPVHWGVEDPGWSVERVVDAVSREHVSCYATRNSESEDWEISDEEFLSAASLRGSQDQYGWECTYPKKRRPKGVPKEQWTRQLGGKDPNGPDKSLLDFFSYRKSDCTLISEPTDPWFGDLPEDALAYPADYAFVCKHPDEGQIMSARPVEGLKCQDQRPFDERD